MRPVRKRKLVDAVCGEWDVSIRRACRVLEVDTSTYHYKSRRPGQAGLEQRIKEICQTRVRYGYRRVHVLLRREGWCINQKKTRRIYRELGLQLRNKPDLFQVRVAPARARAGKARRPPFRPCHANARRSRLGRGHQYACGPFPSRSQLLSPSAMSGLPKPSMSR